LGRQEIGFNVAKSASGGGPDEYGYKQAYHCSGKGQNADWKQDSESTNAQSCQGDNFAVSGHSTQTQEDANQNGHRDGESKHSGKQAQEKFQDLGAGTRVTYKQFHQADKLRNEENESEDGKSEESVPENLADDVAAQDTHSANGECSTMKLKPWGTRKICLASI
jgi:hypothetical protein